MRYAASIVQRIQTQWITSPREIAYALGVPMTPNQWVTIVIDPDNPEQIYVTRWESIAPEGGKDMMSPPERQQEDKGS